MSRLDQDFGGPRPPPPTNWGRGGPPPSPPEDQAVLEKARAQVQAQVLATPAPVTDELGGGTPKESEFHEKVTKVARTYGVTDAVVRGYVEKSAFPGGRSGHQQWDGGYGSNARSALRTIEQQLNFFTQTGMTPNEATKAKYKELLSMKGRESEVASALGIRGFDKSAQRAREYIATLEDQYRDMLRMNVDKMSRLRAVEAFEENLKRLRDGYARMAPDILEKFDAAVARIHAMPKGGRKTRKTRKGRKTRRTRK